jgi:predicted Rossmann-fold nucleotide-binding protein
VVFLDSTGYYAPLFDAFDHMIAAGFVKENYRVLLNRATTVDEAVRIASSPAAAVEGKLIELDITSKKTITS